MLASAIERCTSAMCCPTDSLISGVGKSISDKNLAATSTRAFLGQSWNQSMDVQLIIPGNFLALNLKASPTGEKQRAKWRFFLALLRKNSKS